MDGIKLLTIAALIAAPLSQAEVYKCVQDGKTIYSQDPCADDAAKVDLSNVGSVVGQTGTAINTDDVSHQTSIVKSSDEREEITSYIKAQKLKREIGQLEYKRDQVFKERDRKIARLKSRKNYANNNLAGASWEQSLSQEMQAVTAAAESQIASLDRQIASYQQQLNAL